MSSFEYGFHNFNLIINNNYVDRRVYFGIGLPQL